MSKEIERKYLVRDMSFIEKARESHEITQAYIVARKNVVVRIRIQDDEAFLTIKGENNGPVRNEWEYKIPASEAREMVENLPNEGSISKTRYRVDAGNGLVWEIDCFHGKHEGLVLAEIELPDESTEVVLHSFIGEEVTLEPKYYNSNLAKE